MATTDEMTAALKRFADAERAFEQAIEERDDAVEALAVLGRALADYEAEA